MEQVPCVVLHLTSSVLAKALDEEDSLERPEIGLRREAGVGRDLGSDVVVYADLDYVTGRDMHVIACVGSRENLDAHKPLRGIANVQVRASIAQIKEMGKMSFVWLTMVLI